MKNSPSWAAGHLKKVLDVCGLISGTGMLIECGKRYNSVYGMISYSPGNDERSSLIGDNHRQPLYWKKSLKLYFSTSNQNTNLQDLLNFDYQLLFLDYLVAILAFRLCNIPPASRLATNQKHFRWQRFVLIWMLAKDSPVAALELTAHNCINESAFN